MRNRIFVILMTLLLTLGVSAGAVFAEGSSVYMQDTSAILSQEDQAALETRLSTITTEQNCGVYIRTTATLRARSRRHMLTIIMTLTVWGSATITAGSCWW